MASFPSLPTYTDVSCRTSAAPALLPVLTTQTEAPGEEEDNKTEAPGEEEDLGGWGRL